MSEPSDRLLSAVIDVLVRDGYEGVSVRRVAAAAGVSIGAVQYHFPTKDAMLTAAMDRVSHEFRERLEARLPQGDDPAAALRALSDELLGVEHPRGSVLWVAQLARATVDAGTAERHAREWQEVEDLLARLIGWCAVLAGEGEDEERTRSRAGALLALLDGLATAVLVEPVRMPPGRARALVERHLDDLLAGYPQPSVAEQE